MPEATLAICDATQLDIRKVILQSPQDFRLFPSRNFALELVEGEMNDVVVVDLLRRKFCTEGQPKAMEQVDFLRSQVRRVRAKVEDLLQPVGSMDLKG